MGRADDAAEQQLSASCGKVYQSIPVNDFFTQETRTYFKITLVLSVKLTRIHMVSSIPHLIDQASIVRLILHNLLFCDYVALGTPIVTLSDLEYLFCFLAA